MGCRVEGFNIHHYLETVRKYQEAGYKLATMKECLALDEKKKYLFLRHDVDLSIESAYYMANFEHTMGIKSSYFILLYSPIYNPLAPDSIKRLKSIVEMGHEICYQVDTRFCKSISRDIRMLESVVDTEINCYAPHFITANPPVTKSMLDPYETAFNAMDYTHMNNAKGFHYISESGMNWREGCFCQHIDKYQFLQVLVHPEWWVNEGNRMDVVNIAVEQEVSRIYKEGSDWKIILQNYIRNIETKPVHEEKVLEYQL